MPFTRSMPLLLLAWATATAVCHAGDQVCGTLADDLVATAVGLEREWVVQVPFDSSAARLERVVVADGIVIAQAGDGSVHAIAAAPQAAGQPQPGTVLWSQRVGDAGDEIAPAGAGAIVSVASGLGLVGLDRATGDVMWREQPGTQPEAGTTVSGDWVYVPLSGGTILRLPVNPLRQRVAVEPPPAKGGRKKKQPKRVAESLEPRSIDAGGTIASPVIPFGEGVVWCTTDGRIVALVRSESSWQRREFELGSPPAGPLLVRGTVIHAATTAGDVARIELDKAGLRWTWHIALDDIGDAGPMLADQTLVVPLASGGAAGIAADTGELLWRSDLPRQLLGATPGRLWCIDATGRLASFDPADGGRLEQVCAGSFTVPVINHASDRLVLASPSGVVVSLAARGASAAVAPQPVAAQATSPIQPAEPKPETESNDEPAEPAAEAEAADEAEAEAEPAGEPEAEEAAADESL